MRIVQACSREQRELLEPLYRDVMEAQERLMRAVRALFPSVGMEGYRFDPERMCVTKEDEGGG